MAMSLIVWQGSDGRSTACKITHRQGCYTLYINDVETKSIREEEPNALRNLIEDGRSHFDSVDPTKSLHRCYSEIHAERERQDAKWGGPQHDDTHSPDDWIDFIQQRLLDVISVDKKPTPPCPAYREKLVAVAALAVAAIQSCDRLREAMSTFS